MPDVLVVAELQDAKLRKTTLSAVAAARQIVAAGGAYDLIVLGSGVDGAAKDATTFGARKVFVADDSYLKDYLAERYAPTVAAVTQKGVPGSYALVVATASAYGKD